jgi:hypothetical protein
MSNSFVTSSLGKICVGLFILVALASCDIMFVRPIMQPEAGVLAYVWIGCINIAIGAGLFGLAYKEDDNAASQLAFAIAALAAIIGVLIFLWQLFTVGGGGSGSGHPPPRRR